MKSDFLRYSQYAIVICTIAALWNLLNFRITFAVIFATLVVISIGLNALLSKN